MRVSVSVIIPVYNAGRYLRRCLDSVISQTLHDIEIICIDDGSTDSSREILAGYERTDSRIKVITEANSGPAAARNAGLKLSSGEYVQFLDADDWFESDMLEDMYHRAIVHSADIVICSFSQFDSENGREIPLRRNEEYSRVTDEVFSPSSIADCLFQFTCGQVWDKLFRRDFLISSSLFFPSLRASEDVPFTYRAMLLASRISVIPRVFVHYRVNIEGSVSGSICKYPDAAFDAFRMVYDFLTQRNLMTLYERSFSLWAAEYLSWQICAADTAAVRRHCYELFHREWKRKLRWNCSVLSRLEGIPRMRYLCVRYLPFGVLNGILLLYRKMKGKETR